MLYLAIIALLLYRLGVEVYRYNFKSKHGTKPIKHSSNSLLSWLGINFLLRIKEGREKGNLFDLVQGDFDLLKTNTVVDGFFFNKLIITISPENAKAVVATQFDDFGVGYRPGAFRPLLGNGIFSSEGNTWKHSRAMLRPQFIRQQVADVMTMEPHVQCLASLIRQSKGKSFDIQRLFHMFTIDYSTDFLFGESIDTMKDELENYKDHSAVALKLKRDFNEAFTISQSVMVTRIIAGPLYFLINPKEFQSANSKVHKLVQHFVQKALDASSEELEEKSKKGYVFLYELVKTTRDPQILQDELLNIMLAGRNTTASFLSYLFFELAHNPEIWKKLKYEIQKNFGDGDNLSLITFETLKKCTYLKWCLNETLRLRPSVPINMRVANKDTTLPKGGGPDGTSPIYVRKGQSVFISVYALHRQAQYFGENPNEFIPERWENLSSVGWSFMPFSSGPRICLGQQLALTEAGYVTVRLCQMFDDINLVNEIYPPRTSVNVTSRNMDGVNITLN